MQDEIYFCRRCGEVYERSSEDRVIETRTCAYCGDRSVISIEEAVDILNELEADEYIEGILE